MWKKIEEWKKEIDKWIAVWKADFDSGNYYSLNSDFIKNIKKEVKIEKSKNSKINILFSKKDEWVLV